MESIIGVVIIIMFYELGKYSLKKYKEWWDESWGKDS